MFHARPAGGACTPVPARVHNNPPDVYIQCRPHTTTNDRKHEYEQRIDDSRIMP